ncbi:hypothetical protein BCR36DRAFT_367541 [Piromyces finnis]|uniref:Uncharacterized protein n=1 Tax=Piromyces finnis TaxID=1754191 RepID=A0A1Y1VHS1_9FUNG|nr:hypothetical protein BCR36DRAFT_367541 [Piromyces finnis]|eukprot:ORX56573.1 hypothetical protein BCR36DRAFT_367541 [Piromyces finnis]
MPNEQISNTVLKIVQLILNKSKTGNVNQEVISKYHEYSMKILGSRMSHMVLKDEVHVSTQIKKRCMNFSNILRKNNQNMDSALLFNNLFIKLQSKPILKNKWAVLYFLLNLSEQLENYTASSNLIDTTLDSIQLSNIDIEPKKEDSQVEEEKIHFPETQELNQLKFLNLYYHQNEQQEITEDVLVHDLIYIFQGIHGRYIKFNPETDKFTIDERLKIPKPTYELISKLSELGWLYRQIHQFTYQVQPIGLVRQRFCAALQKELTEYYKLITVLEKCGGGDLISKIHNFVNHGDPFVQNFIHDLLCEVSTPFFDMLKKWIYEGELNDQYNEFFVEEHQDIHGEDLWNLKYSMRQNGSMLPSFINTTLAKKILVIGKSLNFIKDSCNDSEYVLNRSKEAENLNVFNYDSIEALEEIVDENYINTSNYLLDILFTRYKLKDHLNALKRYLLLGQGDFIQNLMDSLGPSLRNKAVGLYRHNLTGSLETAIRASNAQYDDDEILNHLDVRLLSPSEGDVGWDVFTLDYHVSQPLNTIITSSAMEKYRKLFHFLWRLKRVEHTLSASWKRHLIRDYKTQEIRNELHKSNLILSEMIHFIYQLQYYFLFEVLECSWDELNKYIDKHTGNLDQLIKEHNRYLANIIQKGLLAPSEKLIPTLNKLFDCSLIYSKNQNELYNFAENQFSRNKKKARLSYQQKIEAKFGLESSTTYLQDSQISDTQRFYDIKNNLYQTAAIFHENFSYLITRLSNHQNEAFKSLSLRLNFNGYYISTI